MAAMAAAPLLRVASQAFNDPADIRATISKPPLAANLRDQLPLLRCRKRRLKVAVVGMPKTIDNDILLMDKTFGFDTAVEEAHRAINSAYIKAHSAYHGIGIVKLMGRSSGFIAIHVALASGQIDICLILEVPFNLHGPHGVQRHMKYLIETKGSAVVCVAEGARQINDTYVYVAVP
ncbi:ATP-dependent 6-phosphofructokinase 5, chloroplastic-like [Diospyros lotus]|uniref:ATP-dependent 6-phosphofructokinase 5, chloroplastic-like n=1 Tax=Diospyros lotus TaxID=55363 RepID=UPI0022529FEB|nr:ATP-dependent 6-phosphofructokinase 5, chloroplastic-like [Diospyros lotus]